MILSLRFCKTHLGGRGESRTHKAHRSTVFETVAIAHWLALPSLFMLIFMKQAPSEKMIPHVVRLHDEGIICPGEMWNQVSCSLDGYDVPTVLSQLAPNLLSRMYAIYLGRASQPETLLDTSDNTATVINWLIARYSKMS